MINFKFLPIIVILFVVSPLIDYAQVQRECFNTVSFCPALKRSSGFTKNMQSYSGAFEQGDTTEVQIVIYKNMEYRISVCSPSHPELQGKFQFKIVEDVRGGIWDSIPASVEVPIKENGEETGDFRDSTYIKLVRKYVTVEELRYDNSTDEMSQDFIFQSDKTRKLKVKVFVPVSEAEDKSSGFAGSNYVCVGLLIEHQPGIVTGFSR